MSCGRAVAMGERGADAVTIAALTELIATSGARAVAVIGLVKNAGKTTVVNALLAQDGRVYGLTSLGLDGEKVDHLTGLAKPRIAPPQGTLVATTRGSLDRSHYALEILEELPFVTPLGRVVIGRAGEGEVEVSGPTTLAELRTTVERLGVHGAGQVLVDGAINRLGSASPRVSEAVVVATGGMVGDTLPEVVETTVDTYDMLTLPPVSQGRSAGSSHDCCRRRAPSPSPRTARSRRCASRRSSGRASPSRARSNALAPRRSSSAAPSRGTSSRTSPACCRPAAPCASWCATRPCSYCRPPPSRSSGAAASTSRSCAASRAGHHGQPLPGAAAVSTQGVLQRTERGAGREGAALRRRQWSGLGAGRRDRGRPRRPRLRRKVVK